MKKPSAVLPICPVILGTWALCGWMRGGFDRSEAFRTLSAAVDRGVDGFDTAPVYGLGAAECLLGEFSRGFRHRLYIADKCGMVWHTDAGKRAFYADENGTRRAGGHCVRLHLHPESMRFELEQSLRRLQSDYIDLYQIHWYDGVTPWDDIMETMLRFRDEGKIREIGVCNVSTEKILQCLKTAPLASDQERLSLIDRKAEKNNAAFCARRGIGFLAYSPLSFGLLAEETPSDTVFGGSDVRTLSPRFSIENRQKAAALLGELRPFREKYALSCAAFALAWVLNVPGVTHVISGARRIGQLDEDLKALGIRLTDTDRKQVDEILKNRAKDFPSVKH